MKRYVFGAVAIAALVCCLVFYQEIAAALKVIGYVMAGVVAIAGIIGLVFGGWYLIERIRVVRAARIESEKQAHVLTIVSGNQVFIRDTDHRASWRAAHLDSRVYANSQYSEPSPAETWAWEVFNAPKRVYASPTALLPESVESEPLDLLTIFTQPTQSYAVIGGQQTGKTFQMQHIAQYWLSAGLTPIVIGPKWDKGEWAGCILFGGNGDVREVAKGIAIIRKIVEQRHANTTKSHKEHKLLPVFFDDWTPIVDAVENSRQLILEATTLYASVNILLYFILHSDTANAWGVDRKGAALKDNFIKLFVIPSYDANGLIVRNKTQGYIHFAGESINRPARLFNTPVPLILNLPSSEIDTQIVEIEPESQEDISPRVLELFDTGDYSLTGICIQMFGYKNQAKLDQIKRILTANGRIG